MLDILYLARNRLRFTEFSFEMILKNTNWDLADRLIVVDDGSVDGTADWLEWKIGQIDLPVPVELHDTSLGSPVAVMCFYLDTYDSDFFAKVDNDIVVPPGWLERMTETMERSFNVELLGMAAGWTSGQKCGKRGWVSSSHIGGVGLMRTSAFRRRPRPVPNGRFGFTEWQHRYEPVTGWICPDVEAAELDKVPFEPWASLSAKYVDLGWQRHWPPYDAEHSTRFWDWWPK